MTLGEAIDRYIAWKQASPAPAPYRSGPFKVKQVAAVRCP